MLPNVIFLFAHRTYKINENKYLINSILFLILFVSSNLKAETIIFD